MGNEEGERAVLKRDSTPPLYFRSARGTQAHGYASSNSSDAPVFSSDDLAEATIDNYESPRRKRLQKRTWWESDTPVVPSSRSSKRRANGIGADSGIFMGSDSSTDDGFMIEPLSISNTKRQEQKSAPLNTTTRRPSLARLTSAQQIIHRAMDCGSEVIDLSGRGLASLSNSLLIPLKHHIRQPKASSSFSEEVFQPLTPQLQLFLYSNILRSVPSEIMNLEHLTVLSLRNNKLTELPPAISHLRNLVELNVSVNKIRWLPWDMLELIGSSKKLRRFNLCPNPLLHPMKPEGRLLAYNIMHWPMPNQSNSTIEDILTSKLHGMDLESVSQDDPRRLSITWCLKRFIDGNANRSQSPYDDQEMLERIDATGNPGCTDTPVYLGTTSITYLDIDGSVMNASPPPPSQIQSDISVLPVICPPPSSPSLIQTDGSDSGVCSLFELALRSCKSSPDIHLLKSLLPSDSPLAVSRALDLAQKLSDEHPRQCSSCRREYIIPRAEWIEYWTWSDQQFTSVAFSVPFLRRACSRRCAQPTRC